VDTASFYGRDYICSTARECVEQDVEMAHGSRGEQISYHTTSSTSRPTARRRKKNGPPFSVLVD